MADLEGVMLSDYLLLECISKGGVADVYRAHHIQEEGEGRGEGTNYEVAVKVFRPGYAQREAFRDYFMTEAEKIGQFDHPNILPFLEYGEGEGLLYLVTPFVKTGTLEDLLRRVGGRFSAIQTVPIMQQLCSAMQYAHNHDVVHGNIKPTNVLVAADGRMLITDFGIARSYDDSQQSLTRVGWGSAEYIAPEQSLGIVRRASDIYSLGVLLFRILTGSPPFTGQTPVEVLLKHVRQPAPSARSLVPNISDAVDGVLYTALQKRSEDRFSSIDELNSAFLTAVAVAPVASPVARAAAPRLTRALPVENPQTPVPAHATPIGDPQTPVPPYIALERASGIQSIPPQAPDSIPQEDFPQMSPGAPTRSLTRPLVPEEPDPSDTTVVQKKNFLQEDEKQDDVLFWSSDPPEWSPISKETPGDDKAENADNAGVVTHAAAIPLTAEAYLHSKPLLKEQAEPVEQASAMTPVEKEVSRQPLTPGERFKKWLPIIVVILLLLGLIGAVLSAFFFPTEKPSALNGSLASGAGHVVSTVNASPTLIPTAQSTVQKTPASTTTVVAALPTPKPSPSPTPIPTAPPVPPFACTDGTITLDGSTEFNPVIAQVKTDYITQCSTNNVAMNINTDGSKAGLDAVASGSSDLAYSDLASTSHAGLIDYRLAAQTYAVMVNSDTNITQLTTAQLAGIYTGKITNWSQIGGTDEAIVVISRTPGSAIRSTFETYVLKGTQTVDGMLLWSDTTDVVAKKLLGTSGAISYVALGAVPNYGAQSVAINGIAPATAAVADGSYPFWSIIHLYSNHIASGLALSFISFFTTADGQNDLAMYGAINVKAIPQSILNTRIPGPKG